MVKRFQGVLAGVALAVLIVVAGWPFVSRIDVGAYPGDAYLLAHVMETQMRAYSSDLSQLMDYPVFHPFPRAATFTDPLYAVTPVFALFRALGAEPIPAQNWLTMLALFFSAWFTWLLCRRGFAWPVPASALTAVYYTFTHLHISMLGALTVLWHPWLTLMPLLVYFYLKKPGWLRAAAIALALVLQFYSSVYAGIFTLATLLAFWVFASPLNISSRKTRTIQLRLAAALCLGLVLIGWLLLQYKITKDLYSFKHGEEIHQRHSLSLDQLLFNDLAPEPSIEQKRLPGYSHLSIYELPMGRLESLVALGGFFLLCLASRRKEKSRPWRMSITGLQIAVALYAAAAGFSIIARLFVPALLPLAVGINDAFMTFQLGPLLTVLLLFLLSREQELRVRMLFGAAAMGIIALSIAMGPEMLFQGTRLGSGLKSLLLALLPGFDAIRSSYRWLLLTVAAMSLLAGYLLNQLHQRHRPGAWIASCILIAITLVSFNGRLHELPDIENYDLPAYRWLARQPGDFAVLNIPFHPTNAGETNYMMGQLIHGKRLVNGYSGFLPAEIEELRMIDISFPDQRSFDVIRSVPARYLLVHTSRLRPGQLDSFNELANSGDPWLRLVHKANGVYVFAIDRGGSGKEWRTLVPAWQTSLSFDIRAKHEMTGTQFCSFYVDGKEQKTIEIAAGQSRVELAIHGGPQHGFPHEFAAWYHYSHSSPTSLPDGSEIPFALDLNSGLGNPNRANAGINGGYYPADKGFNCYLLSSGGEVLQWHNFNTSYFAGASEEIAGFIEGLPQEGYLISLIGYDAGRSITREALDALASLGINSKPLSKEFQRHISIVELTSGRVLFDVSRRGGVALKTDNWLNEAGFEIGGFSAK